MQKPIFKICSVSDLISYLLYFRFSKTKQIYFLTDLHIIFPKVPAYLLSQQTSVKSGSINNYISLNCRI